MRKWWSALAPVFGALVFGALVLAGMMPAMAQEPNTGDDGPTFKFVYELPAGWYESSATPVGGTTLYTYVAADDDNTGWERKLSVFAGGAGRGRDPEGLILSTREFMDEHFCSSVEWLEPMSLEVDFGALQGELRVMYCIAKIAARKRYAFVRKHELVVMAAAQEPEGDFYWAQWAFHTDDDTQIETVLEREAKDGIEFLLNMRICKLAYNGECPDS